MNNRDDLIYLAPMEGITGYIYRNAHHKYFGGVDKYFMPFIAPAKGRPLRNRELRDVLPEKCGAAASDQQRRGICEGRKVPEGAWI